MDQETLNFYNWQLEQEEAERIKEAVKQADSGNLTDHTKLKQMAAGWCKIEPSKLDEVVIAGRKDARIMWSDAAVSGLQQTCEYMAQRRDADGLTTTEPYLKRVLSTVELIASYPDVGRPGLVKGTREWGMGFYGPTVAYRYLLGEIQVLGELVSHRKWPHMKSASGRWADKKSVS
jgi:plasmid stabilization system protein ParE